MTDLILATVSLVGLLAYVAVAAAVHEAMSGEAARELGRASPFAAYLGTVAILWLVAGAPHADVNAGTGMAAVLVSVFGALPGIALLEASPRRVGAVLWPATLASGAAWWLGRTLAAWPVRVGRAGGERVARRQPAAVAQRIEELERELGIGDQ